MDWRIWVPIGGCIIHVIAVLICYGLTKHLSREWLLSLTSISENSPESTLFTIGTTIAGVTYLITTILRHQLLERTLCYLERENLIMLKSARKLRAISCIATALGCFGSLFTCLVGLRVFMAYKFGFIMAPYVFFVACMWVNTLIGYLMKRRRMFFYFFVLSFCGLGSLIIAMVFELAGNYNNMQAISAVASYIVIATFIRFISLYSHDFQNSSFMALDRLVTNIYGTPFTQNVSVNNNSVGSEGT